MSHAAAVKPVPVPASGGNVPRVLQILAWGLILAVAAAFVGKYVFHYYLNYNQEGFKEGAPNYWEMRYWLVLHITGGMLALLSGPWQFWAGLRRRYLRLHRWTGRLFLVGVVAGSVGAIQMAVSTTFGWAWAVALLVLAAAWLTTAGISWYAILKRNVAVHKDWMMRAYAVTFAFVTFRLLNDYGPTSHVRPVGDRMVTYLWLSWVVPLMVIEVVLQLRRLRVPASRL
jgi:uncharacterized membrane protein YozB (DUF420 family)